MSVSCVWNFVNASLLSIELYAIADQCILLHWPVSYSIQTTEFYPFTTLNASPELASLEALDRGILVGRILP